MYFDRYFSYQSLLEIFINQDIDRFVCTSDETDWLESYLCTSSIVQIGTIFCPSLYQNQLDLFYEKSIYFVYITYFVIES